MLFLKSNASLICFACNTGSEGNDPWIPELWANETLAILEENMVIGNLVHRDFEPIIAKFGDVVNTRRPGEFKAKRKVCADNVTVQESSATNVPVPLNQHVHVSFLICDDDESLSFKSLVDEYLRPATVAQARFVDQVLLGQVYQFLANSEGGLGTISSSNAKKYILDTRNRMNINKAYMEGRNLIWAPNSETAALNTDLFISCDKRCDGGFAMQEAHLGRLLGFDHWMAQNTPSVPPGNTAKTGEINNAAGYPAGTITVTVDGFTGAVADGEYVTIEGDDVVHRIYDHTETLGNTTSITFYPPLKRAVLDNADVRVPTAGAINLVAGYPVCYAKEIVVDGFTVAPQIGQLVSFGSPTTAAEVIASPVYSIIDVNGLVGITLDRPLDLALTNNDAVNLGPAGTLAGTTGDYNFAFHRNALALVVRPLALPRAGTGALSGVVNFNDLSMRTVITYDGNKQGHLVTIDMLMGIAVLDTDLGAVLLG
jgi:hypothetical protein